MYMNKDIDDYQNRLDDKQILKLLKHCNRYKINPIICAWYDNWEDFCSDWCNDLGYSRTEARRILHGGKGEFKIFNNGEIVRLVL